MAIIEGGRGFIGWFAPAIGLDPANIDRIVIDAKHNDVMMVYVTLVGTKEGLLKLEMPEFRDMKITVVGEK